MSEPTMDEAFYRLTVAQRDAAWREVETLSAALVEARAEIDRLTERLQRQSGHEQGDGHV